MRGVNVWTYVSVGRAIEKDPRDFTPLRFPAVSLSHQRRRRRLRPSPPLSPRGQTNGRTPGADPSPPKRNWGCLCLPAVPVGAGKPLLLQHLLLVLQGKGRAWSHPSLGSAPSYRGSAVCFCHWQNGGVWGSSLRLAAQ